MSSVTPWPLYLSAESCSRMTHTGSPPLMGFLQQEWAYWAYWAYCLKHVDSKRDLTWFDQHKLAVQSSTYKWINGDLNHACKLTIPDIETRKGPTQSSKVWKTFPVQMVLCASAIHHCTMYAHVQGIIHQVTHPQWDTRHIMIDFWRSCPSQSPRFSSSCPSRCWPQQGHSLNPAWALELV